MVFVVQFNELVRATTAIVFSHSLGYVDILKREGIKRKGSVQQIKRLASHPSLPLKPSRRTARLSLAQLATQYEQLREGEKTWTKFRVRIILNKWIPRERKESLESLQKHTCVHVPHKPLPLRTQSQIRGRGGSNFDSNQSTILYNWYPTGYISLLLTRWAMASWILSTGRSLNLTCPLMQWINCLSDITLSGRSVKHTHEYDISKKTRAVKIPLASLNCCNINGNRYFSSLQICDQKEP